MMNPTQFVDASYSASTALADYVNCMDTKDLEAPD